MTDASCAKRAEDASNDNSNRALQSVTADPRHQAVAKFRASCRDDSIPADYSPHWHFATINAAGIGMIVCFAWMAGGPRAMLTHAPSVLCMIVAYLVANYFEYYVHRSNFHNPLVSTRHVSLHHRFFTKDVMEYNHWRDVHLILFAPKAPIFLVPFICVLAVPVALVAGLQAGASFACVLAAYYLSYEYLHLAYHSPPSSFLGSLPFIAFLRRHHQIHHAQPLMGKYNFNITVPLADWVFGTTYKETTPQKQVAAKQ